MSQIAPSDDPHALQRARAQHLTELLEPWSARKIEARTGIGRNAIRDRLNGKVALGIGDLELLAPLIRMTPEELFKELRSVKLPHLDSNQEPAG